MAQPVQFSPAQAKDNYESAMAWAEAHNALRNGSVASVEPQVNGNVRMTVSKAGDETRIFTVPEIKSSPRS